MELFSSLASALAVPRSIGQIYGILYASPRPLGFSDIVARLDISKGSVSQGLTLLKALGAINQVEPKERAEDAADPSTGSGPRQVRVIYEPELSLRRLVSGILSERIAPLAEDGADRLSRLRDLARQGNGAGREFYVSRATQLNGWRKRLKIVLPVIVALLGSGKP